MIDWSECDVVKRRDTVLGGAWVFRGIRIPVAAVFENLESGASINDFTEWFPGVTLTQVQSVLEYAARSAAA